MEPYMITTEEARRSKLGPYAVSVIRNHRVKLSDGVELSAKIWFPETNMDVRFPESTAELWYSPQDPAAVTDATYPTILEYLPYRKSDFTAMRDYIRHTWFCSHGYVCARFDIRGSGSSGGLYFDEYAPQEQQDACEVITWISRQQWSNGRVGMYGKSWGGFNGLQVAYQQPAALRAVISLYSTDDRYATDVHYDGGCVLAEQMLSWSSCMLAWKCAPPDPSETPDWRRQWQERLDKASTPWVHNWMSHQFRDDYWKHGSICEDFSRIKCPVLAIGGWEDGYYDAVFRLVEGLSNCRGIVGPWAHEWPDWALPGPNMEYLGECLAWWDFHLKGIDNGAMDVPKLRLYLKHSVPPSPRCERQPGRWVVLNDLQAVEGGLGVMKLLPVEGRLMPATWLGDGRTRKEVAYTSLACGMYAGSWLSFGGLDGPLDQRSEDAHCLAWTTDTLELGLEILGFPALHCKVSVDRGHSTAQICARLCDVLPDGRSALICYGLLNLAHRNGHGEGDVKELTPGEFCDVTVTFHSAGYSVPAGHRLRLCVSPSYWPIAWPAPQASNLCIETGLPDSTYLTLPILQNGGAAPTGASASRLTCSSPTTGPSPPVDQLSPASQTMEVRRNWETGVLTKRNGYSNGRQRFKDTGQVLLNEQMDTFTIKPEDPLSAKVVCDRVMVTDYPETLSDPPHGRLKARVQTNSQMTCDEQYFIFNNHLEVFLNDETYYKKDWAEKIERCNV